VKPEHLHKLALVYIRQSTPQQVLENRESRERQYALADYARALGWQAERVQIIDEDQGQSGASADQRIGFQRLLTEVSLDHVGLVLGLEMSRLARSSKDWHQLLDVCGVFGTLLADQDGVYDASDANDRLLLGLKGTISEVELHTMRNRLERGRLNKAHRGELFHGVPIGYVVLPSGKVDFDSDEQARDVVRLVFDKFEELGTVYAVFRWLIEHNVRMPVRPRSGPSKGELEWRRASLPTLRQMLHHPMYAGVYVYGRRPRNAKSKYGGTSNYQPRVPKEEWKVHMPDVLPAYISRQQFEKNCERISQNRNVPNAVGTPRRGIALLAGLVECGNCGAGMQVTYPGANHDGEYCCRRHITSATELRCFGSTARVIDSLVSQQVLRALEPAALELSLEACGDVERERERLDKHWQQNLQRARYEAELAERRYRAVDPDNRLVISSLEKNWEEALGNERRVREEYDRFALETPLPLTANERSRIEALASDIPALWKANGVTNADRKEIVRTLVERVVLHVRCDSEFVDATIRWAGGYESRHEIIRPVATYAQLRDFELLMERVAELREAGHSAQQTAEQLNAEGFHTPRGDGKFNQKIVYSLVYNKRSGIGQLGENEWWLADLARKLKMSRLKLRDWAERQWVHSRRTPIQKRWVLWADEEELERLRQLAAESQRGVNAHRNDLRSPKNRP
jgi:DNA invertase Pin-like site-specific DNA recombinase